MIKTKTYMPPRVQNNVETRVKKVPISNLNVMLGVCHNRIPSGGRRNNMKLMKSSLVPSSEGSAGTHCCVEVRGQEGKRVSIQIEKRQYQHDVRCVLAIRSRRTGIMVDGNVCPLIHGYNRAMGNGTRGIGRRILKESVYYMGRRH